MGDYISSGLIRIQSDDAVDSSIVDYCDERWPSCLLLQAKNLKSPHLFLTFGCHFKTRPKTACPPTLAANDEVGSQCGSGTAL